MNTAATAADGLDIRPRQLHGGVFATYDDHRLATAHHLFRFEKGKQRRSQDGDYHLCLYPDEHTPRCFYAPDMGF